MAFLKAVRIHAETTVQRGIEMATIRLNSIGYPGIPETQMTAVRDRLAGLLDSHKIIWAKHDFKGLLFASGGSESESLRVMGDDRHLLLLAFAENNAYAAASEVKAWLDDKGIPADLFNLSDPIDLDLLKDHIELIEKTGKISHKRMGQVGDVAPWLIQSNPDPELIRNRLGHRIIKIPFSVLPEITDTPVSPDFLELFQGYGKKEWENHSRVHNLLSTLIQEHALDGIAVECFPMVQEQGLTACLSLAMINHLGTPAACEADMLSLTGMLMLRDLTGTIPWMANLSGLFHDHVEWSHCTVPLNLINDFSVTTHFETGNGLAIDGMVDAEEVTMFRLNKWLDRAFVSEGSIREKGSVRHSCRTRITVNLAEEDVASLRLHPLGNHHLILPGKHGDMIRKALRILNITPIN